MNKSKKYKVTTSVSEDQCVIKVQNQSVLQRVYQSLSVITLIFLLLLGASVEGVGQIISWDLNGQNGNQASNNSSAVVTGINTGVLTRGSGLTAVNGSGTMNSSGWTTNNYIDVNDYYQFTVPIANGYVANITTIEIALDRNNSGADIGALRSSLSNYTNNIGSTVTITTTTKRFTFTLNAVNLTGTITFRLYGYSAGNNNGTMSIGAINGNDISVNGSVIAVPTITSFTPNNACSGSGTSVVITGTNFTGATAVSFNGVPATSYTVNDATQITATMPAGAATGVISVTTAGGTATSSSAFTVNSIPSAPVVGTITQPTCLSATGSVVLNGLPSSGTWTLTRNDGVTTTGTGTSTTLSNLPEGTYTYTVTGENTSTACPGSGTGLTGEYFNNVPTSGVPVISGTPELILTDQTIDFNWANGGPGSPLGNDYFAVRWTGKIQPCFTEIYTFTTQSDDGIRLSVNGNQIINNWTDHANTSNSGTISLNAGQKYDIVLEFYERAGQAVAQLFWSSASQPYQIIPMSQLYSVATGCTSVSSASVTINPQPTASTAPTGITGNTTICSGASTMLTVSGGSLGTGASWNWYSGSCGGTFVGTGNSITVYPTTTTTYFVRAEGMCNTTTCASGTITVNPLPTANISDDNGPLCAGDDAVFNLTGTAGAILTYKVNSGSEQTIALTGGVATIYINNVTDDQVLTLISVTNGTCSQNLNTTSTIIVHPIPEIGSFN